MSTNGRVFLRAALDVAVVVNVVWVCPHGTFGSCWACMAVLGGSVSGVFCRALKVGLDFVAKRVNRNSILTGLLYLQGNADFRANGVHFITGFHVSSFRFQCSAALPGSHMWVVLFMDWNLKLHAILSGFSITVRCHILFGPQNPSDSERVCDRQSTGVAKTFGVRNGTM